MRTNVASKPGQSWVGLVAHLSKPLPEAGPYPNRYPTPIRGRASLPTTCDPSPGSAPPLISPSTPIKGRAGCQLPVSPHPACWPPIGLPPLHLGVGSADLLPTVPPYGHHTTNQPPSPRLACSPYPQPALPAIGPPTQLGVGPAGQSPSAPPPWPWIKAHVSHFKSSVSAFVVLYLVLHRKGNAKTGHLRRKFSNLPPALISGESMPLVIMLIWLQPWFSIYSK